MPRAHSRRAHHGAVEQHGIALRGQHALAPASRATGNIGMMRYAPVMSARDLLTQLGNLGHGLPGKIERGLLIGHKGRVETVLAFVPAIGGDHRKAPRQCRRVARRVAAKWRVPRAIQPAPAPNEEATVPGRWHGQWETRAGGFTVHTPPVITYAL